MRILVNVYVAAALGKLEQQQNQRKAKYHVESVEYASTWS